MRLAIAASQPNADRTDPQRSLASLAVPAFELLVVLGLVEIDLWYLRGTDNPLLHAAVFAAIGMAICRSVQRRQKSGSPAPTPSAAARAWAESLLLLASVTLLLFATAWFFRDSDEGFRFFFRQRPVMGWLMWLSGRVAGAVVQQLGLQLLIGPACREIVRPGALAACAAGLLFGVLHLPHPILLAIGVVVGSLWVWLYNRSGRLAPVMVCHAVLSILAAGTLPKSLIADMDIGTCALDQMIHPRYRCTEDVREAVAIVRTDAYYTRHGGTPRAYIAAIYRDFLGRGPTDGELDRWLIELSQNSRARTALSMFKSKGFERVQVRVVANRMRAAHADDFARNSVDDSQRR